MFTQKETRWTCPARAVISGREEKGSFPGSEVISTELWIFSFDMHRAFLGITGSWGGSMAGYHSAATILTALPQTAGGSSIRDGSISTRKAETMKHTSRNIPLNPKMQVNAVLMQLECHFQDCLCDQGD